MVIWSKTVAEVITLRLDRMCALLLVLLLLLLLVLCLGLPAQCRIISLLTTTTTTMTTTTMTVILPVLRVGLQDSTHNTEFSKELLVVLLELFLVLASRLFHTLHLTGSHSSSSCSSIITLIIARTLCNVNLLKIRLKCFTVITSFFLCRYLR